LVGQTGLARQRMVGQQASALANYQAAAAPAWAVERLLEQVHLTLPVRLPEAA